MDNHQVDRLKVILGELGNLADKKVVVKLELEKCIRIVQKLAAFSSECEECRQYLSDLESHLLRLYDKGSQLSEDDFKRHKQLIRNISSHLMKEHKLVTKGYYTSIYMSVGVSIGLLFGLLVFENIALGLPIGIGVGIAMGAGMDEKARKEDRVL